MERQRFLDKLGNAATRIVFGPRVEGTVELVLRDPHDRNYWHVLVKTSEGAKKHFTLMNTALAYTQEEGIGMLELPYKKGQRVDMRIRGTGLFLLPGSKVQRDPFNLKNNNR